MQKTLIFTLLIAYTSLVQAQSLWDIRHVANSTGTVTSLVFPDKSPYMNMSGSDAKTIVAIVDKYSELSGIYPKVFLTDINDFNAAATYVDGMPVIYLNKRMYEFIVQDKGAAAALIGHEMAHLYFRHSDGRAETRSNAAAAGAIIGSLVEIFFIRRFGVVGIGANVGNAFRAGIVGAYTRPQESEADKQGMIWAIQSGYDPHGAARLFAEMERRIGNSSLPFLQSHPNPAERIESAKVVSALYEKYKNIEVISSPELQALNKKIDEDRERQLPTSEAAKSGIIALSKKDFASAKAGFEECARSGEISCINNLGVLYQFGLGVTVGGFKSEVQPRYDASVASSRRLRGVF